MAPAIGGHALIGPPGFLEDPARRLLALERPGASVGAGQPVPERPRDEDSPLPSHQAVTGFAESRASKMDHDDFMRLLAQFNQAGVHFSS